jgi:hypothetical protein
MLKNNTIIILILLFFSLLNVAPYFMIRCTETDGNNHMENVFNRCCTSPMHTMQHSSKQSNEAAFSVRHCQCSVNISSGEYLIPHTDKILTGQDIMTYTAEMQGEIKIERSFSGYKSESPPLSINLVRSAVLLI